MFMPINLPLFGIFTSSFVHMTYDHLPYEASVMKFNLPTLAFNVAFYQIADSNCCQLYISHPSLSHFDSVINTPMFYLLKHTIFIHEIK